MKSAFHFLSLTFVFLLTSSAANGQNYSLLEAKASKSEYFALEKAYSEMKSENKNDPKALYLAGYAQMRLHKPLSAKPLFESCISKNFNGFSGWQSAKSFLNEITLIKQHTPPFYADFPNKQEAKLMVYANGSGWSTPILIELKHFVRHARSVLGNDIPTINMYLFQKRANYNQFFASVFLNKPRAWQDGTGDSNIVVFCEQDKNGLVISPSIRVAANTLHEYGHSLCNTIYGDNYLTTVPQWFDEGLADAIAAPYNEVLFREAERILKVSAQNHPPPQYRQMCRELYNDPNLRYAYARLMVRELLRDRPRFTARKIIVRARHFSSFEQAIREVTGIDSARLLADVYNKYK